MAETNSKTSSAATAQDAVADPLIGRLINDRFRVVSEIARGGMGRVYKAEQLPLGRECALKVLSPASEPEHKAEFHKRFLLEASVAAKLHHPNAVTIFDYGECDDVYYIAMEYLEGRTLHKLITEDAPLEPRRALKITSQVCRALRDAHKLGVIHRDLKPANIFLVQHDDDADFVKVLDFGLVKTVGADSSDQLTHTGLFMGSPKYMAPEQIRGETVAPATDVYAMGVVLYAMLTRKAPFDRKTALDTLAAHLSEPVPTFESRAPEAPVPEPIARVVYRCMQKSMADRYASMDELLVALRNAQAEVFGERFSITGTYALGAGSGVSGEFGVTQGEPTATVSGSVPNAVRPVFEGASATGPLLPDADGSRPRRSGLATVLVGGVVVLALGGVGLAAALRHGAAPGAEAQRGTPAAPSSVHVSLDSDPAGAEVFEGPHSLGHTPLRLEWTGVQGDPSLSHTFTFRLPAFRETEVTLSGATMAYSAHLERTPAAPTAGNGGTGSSSGSAAAGANAGNAGGARPRPGGAVAPRGAHGPATGRRPPGAGVPRGYRDIDDW